jgi:hypothetical protein
MSKKIKKPIKPRKTKKKQPKPNWIQTGKKPESNQKKIEPNRFEPVFVLKNRTETGRFEPVSVFKKKIGLVIFFLWKPNQTELKMITPTNHYKFFWLYSFSLLNIWMVCFQEENFVSRSFLSYKWVKLVVIDN